MTKIDHAARDAAFWERMQQLFDKNAFGAPDILGNFAAYVRRRDMVRFLAHYELFKHIVDLPGCVVETGVFRGASFFTWTKLMETFCPGDRSRRVYGFDHFDGLGALHEADGGEAAEGYAKTQGGYASSLENIKELVALHNADGLVADVERCRIINGDVSETVPTFLEQTPGLRIALLHLDVDLYEPTKVTLEHFFDRVVTGGVIVFDEYGLVPWEGESRAVEEFFAARGMRPEIRKFPFSQTPHGYMIKG